MGRNTVEQERQIVARYARLTPSCKAGAYKIQVWKTTKGTNSKIKQARVMIPVHCTSPLWDLSTHEIS